MIKTEIGYTTPETITVRGKNLATELLGKVDFVDMMLLTIFNRTPSPAEKAMINHILVTACDHGLTPSAMSARLTFLGAPEAMQAAVAAGLLGAGSVFLGTTQNCAEMLAAGAADLSDDPDQAACDAAARAMLSVSRAKKQPVYGIGHPIHVHGDPRVPTLCQLAQELGFHGKHWRLMDAVHRVLLQDRNKNLPMNVVGAIGAIICDMGLDPMIARGLMLVGRAGGLVAHLYEEREHPIGQQIWDLVLAQDERNVAPVR
ncbi:MULTISPECIES: citryl-CoA lyase [Achromobacter]|uniref:citrate synthase (unknown stereospecificity) n=1 Tax=Alcaligenes xylosoxydans xylosoxydans TaxID=85698 RepID=A0A424WFN3_ALCXX|nr:MULTISPECIES: citryl-CoA lyase [Achromobacter]MBC9905823.1 citryl-CoA lyase [Achromobacter xylosoxidans]MBD0869292.1 citryl-CoA lyase [Achromobacter xylosoxidans]QNP86180.1 citryl-CoA lyase [Achromobacter xylosoxidans]RPJ92088.1 citryl-CoA lyase [Achromobacter xylosoxidans]